MTAGALAAVYDGQDDGLALAVRTAQAEEAHRGVGIQAVATALAHRLQIWLLCGEREEGGGEEGDEVTGDEARAATSRRGGEKRARGIRLRKPMRRLEHDEEKVKIRAGGGYETKSEKQDKTRQYELN